MPKQKYLITQLVYGDTYAKLFCNNHVKSILDPSNIPAITDKYDVEYLIFTDQDTHKTLAYNPWVKKLAQTVKVSINLFAWPNKGNRFQMRYGLLLEVFRQSVQKALTDGAILTTWVADLVVAQDFFPRILARMDAGHGAVFVLPLRSASEAVTPKLAEVHHALPDIQLFNIGFEALHPLWVACHWDNPQFTKLPFTLLWNSGGGLLARSFSTTPIVFKPTEAMLSSRGMIDGDIPGLCENPYWCEDWTDAPVIGVEPLICYYPPFANRPASTGWVNEWTACLDQTQVPFLNKRLYYPNKKTASLPPAIMAESDRIVREVTGGVSVEQAHAG